MSKFMGVIVLIVLLLGWAAIDAVENELIVDANLCDGGADLLVYYKATGPADITTEFVSDKEGEAYSCDQQSNVTGIKWINMGNVSNINGTVYITARSKLFWRDQQLMLHNSQEPA